MTISHLRTPRDASLVKESGPPGCPGTRCWVRPASEVQVAAACRPSPRQHLVWLREVTCLREPDGVSHVSIACWPPEVAWQTPNSGGWGCGWVGREGVK